MVGIEFDSPVKGVNHVITGWHDKVFIYCIHPIYIKKGKSQEKG